MICMARSNPDHPSVKPTFFFCHCTNLLFFSRKGLTHMLMVIIPFLCIPCPLSFRYPDKTFSYLVTLLTQLAYCPLNIPRFFSPSAQYRSAQLLCVKPHLFLLFYLLDSAPVSMMSSSHLEFCWIFKSWNIRVAQEILRLCGRPQPSRELPLSWPGYLAVENWG